MENPIYTESDLYQHLSQETYRDKIIEGLYVLYEANTYAYMDFICFLVEIQKEYNIRFSGKFALGEEIRVGHLLKAHHRSITIKDILK